MFPKDWGLPAEESGNSLLRGWVRAEQRHYVSAPPRSAANSLAWDRSLDQHRGFEYASHWRKLIGQGATRPPARRSLLGCFLRRLPLPTPPPYPPFDRPPPPPTAPCPALLVPPLWRPDVVSTLQGALYLPKPCPATQFSWAGEWLGKQTIEVEFFELSANSPS